MIQNLKENVAPNLFNICMQLNSAICILMGTYNGEAFLADQLLSIENQSHTHWRLIISDDGSTDDTLAIAKSFQDKWGSYRLEIRAGPQQGFCTNFLSQQVTQLNQRD